MKTSDYKSFAYLENGDIVFSEFENKLTIGSADKIHWKWFSYGKPQTDDNLYFIEINRKENLLTGNSNVDWYQPDFKDLNLINPALLWT